MRVYRATNDRVMVSANDMETAINTEQTPDTSLLVAVNTTFKIDSRREDNKDELSGYEESTTVYDRGQTASSSFAFDKMQAQFAAFCGAFGLGACTTAAYGTGYKHTITPTAVEIDSNRANPSFTAVMKYADVMGIRFASCFIDSFSMTFARDSFVKLSANIKATGKTTVNYTEETVTAKDNVTELTLDANGVVGSTAAERLTNVHRIIAETDTGIWDDVAFTAVSAATPAVITIGSVGGAGSDDIDYKILYIPAPAATWLSDIAMIQETPLQTSQVSINYGGTWSGSAFEGGTDMKCPVKQIVWEFNNNLAIEFCFGEAGAYAGRAWRDARTQTLKLDREMRDAILKADMGSNREFGMRIYAEGEEFETGKHYSVEVIFPRLMIKMISDSVDGKRLAESAEISVLQDTTYGSVIMVVTNKVATYAA